MQISGFSNKPYKYEDASKALGYFKPTTKNHQKVKDVVDFETSDFEEFSEITVNLMGYEELAKDFSIMYNEELYGLSEKYLSNKYCHDFHKSHG